MRFEFVEMVVRLAQAKYLKVQLAESFAQAVHMVVEHNLQLLPAARAERPNDFRRNHLYCKAVEDVLIRHKAWLAALHTSVCEVQPGSSERSSFATLGLFMDLVAELDICSPVRGQSLPSDSKPA